MSFRFNLIDVVQVGLLNWSTYIELKTNSFNLNIPSLVPKAFSMVECEFDYVYYLLLSQIIFSQLY